MTEPPGLPFDDLDQDAAAELYDRCRAALLENVSEFAEAEQLDAELVSDLLLDLALGFTTVDYLDGTEKPSVGGLKLHLDRLRRDFDELVRFEKKHAEERIEQFKAVLNAVVDSNTDEGPET